MDSIIPKILQGIQKILSKNIPVGYDPERFHAGEN
jgi:hypothetical protein